MFLYFVSPFVCVNVCCLLVFFLSVILSFFRFLSPFVCLKLCVYEISTVMALNHGNFFFFFKLSPQSLNPLPFEQIQFHLNNISCVFSSLKVKAKSTVPSQNLRFIEKRLFEHVGTKLDRFCRFKKTCNNVCC